MKNWTKALGLAGLAVAFSLTFQTDASAAEVTGVMQTAASTSNIKLQWNKTENAFRYEYALTDTLTGEEKKGTSYNVGTIVENLNAGKTYRLTLTAYGSQGYLGASEPIEVVTAPDTHRCGLSQTSSTATSVTMTAMGVDDANFFVVKDGENVVTTSESATNIIVTGLMPNTSYTYNIFPARKSAAGFIAEGVFKTCEVRTRDWNGDDTKTPSNNDFGISSSSQTEDAYTFFVNGTLGVSSGFELEIQEMNGTVKKLEKTSSMEPVIVRKLGLNNGGFYKYHVRIYAKAGAEEKFSAWSNFKYIQGAIKNASVKKEKKAFKITWDAVSGAKNYVVYASTSAKKGFKKVKSVTGKSLSINKVAGKALKKKKTYYFRIEAYAVDGKKQVKSANTYSLSAKF